MLNHRDNPIPSLKGWSRIGDQFLDLPAPRTWQSFRHHMPHGTERQRCRFRLRRRTVAHARQGLRHGRSGPGSRDPDPGGEPRPAPPTATPADACPEAPIPGLATAPARTPNTATPRAVSLPAPPPAAVRRDRSAARSVMLPGGSSAAAVARGNALARRRLSPFRRRTNEKARAAKRQRGPVYC